MFVNYFTIPFRILTRYYRICIFRSMRHGTGLYNYLVADLKATNLLKIIVEPENKILTLNVDHHAET